MDYFTRKSVLVRDGYKCTKCSCTLLSEEESKRVPRVHHKDEIGGDGLDNLTSLCSSCHAHLPRSVPSVAKLDSSGAEPKNIIDKSIELPGRSRYLPPKTAKSGSYTVNEVAKILGRSPKSMYRWRDKGYFTYTITPMGQYRVSRLELERLWKMFGGKVEEDSSNV